MEQIGHDVSGQFAFFIQKDMSDVFESNEGK